MVISMILEVVYEYDVSVSRVSVEFPVLCKRCVDVACELFVDVWSFEYARGFRVFEVFYYVFGGFYDGW